MIFTRNKQITVEWFNVLLLSIIEKLPKEYSGLEQQVNDGLIRTVYKRGFAGSNYPDYIGVGYNTKVVDKHDKLKGVEPAEIDKKGLSKSFALSGIKIYHTKTNSFIAAELFIGDGMIMGIVSTPSLNMRDFDNRHIAVDEVVKRYL
jgi:hypothetical protein